MLSSELTNDSKQLAAQSLRELRTLSYLLHPPILDHAGLVRALQWFVRGFSERTGIRVDAGAVQDIGPIAGRHRNCALSYRARGL
jgi:signal transduction histidine kinase